MTLLQPLGLSVVLSFAWVGIVCGDPLDNWHFRNPLPIGNALSSVTSGGGQFVAVGNAGTVLTSSDGVSWVPQRSATETNLNLVGYGNGMYVAFGTNGYLQTSADGTNWTRQVCPTTDTINALTYGNGTFVAVGGQVSLTSSNGMDWVSHPVVLPYSYESLVSDCFGNGKFLAISRRTLAMSADGVAWTTNSLPGDGVTIAFGRNHFVLECVEGNMFLSTHLLTSSDGLAWVDQTGNSIGPDWQESGFFIYNDDQTSFLLWFPQGTYASPDGLAWTQAIPGLPIPRYPGLHKSGAYAHSTYVAVGNDSYIWRSTDGSNWVNQTHGSFDFLYSIASGNGIYVGVGGTQDWTPASGSNFVLRSADGLSYAPANTPFTNSLFSDVVFAMGSFTAVGQTGLVVQSTDGNSWTQRNSGSVETLYRITAGNGLLVAVGKSGRIQTSPNGRVWTGRTSGTDQALFGVAYGNGNFVTVGYGGTILTSPDTLFWTAQDSGGLKLLSGVVYGPAGFVAVGEGGTIITSSDGVTWSAANQSFTNDLLSVCYGNGQYLAVGAALWPSSSRQILGPPQHPIILSSSDGIQWVRHNSGNTDAGYYGCAFANNRFLVVGNHGTILESDAIPAVPFSLSARQTFNGLTLTVYSPPSPSLRIQANSDLSLGGWSDVASFTNVSGTVQWTDSVSQTQRIYRAVSP